MKIRFEKRHAHLLLVVLALAAFYFLTQFSTERIIGNDGHFHIRYSNLMLERGLPDRLPELKYTTWGESYRDYHFLFHILLIPFSLIPDILIGGKIAAAFFATLSALIFYFILKSLKVNSPLVWLVLFIAGSAALLFRIQMPRVQSLALALILLVIWALIKRRYILLFVLGFINVWLYDSFLLLFIVGASWLFSARIILDKWDLKPFIYLLVGIIAGSVINPYFPHNFTSYFDSVKRALAPYGSIPLPAEWHPDTGWQMIMDNAGIIAISVVISITYLAFSLPGSDDDKNRKSERLFLFALAFIFTLMMFKARRFAEYAPPILILYMAVVYRDMTNCISTEVKRTATVLMIIIVMASGLGNIYNFINTNRSDDNYKCYLRAGEWLKNNAKIGDVVFSTDWDDFPPLYMEAPKLEYVVGMDPLFMMRYNETLYNTYCDITVGRKEGSYLPIIKHKFKAKYVFSDTEHGDFLNKFDREPEVYRVFNEKKCRIYQIGRK